MLGIDISENAIRVVRLRRRGSGFVLQPPLVVPLEKDQKRDPNVMGKQLARALQKRGWHKQKAVMTLPDRLSHIRRLSLDKLKRQNTKSNGHLSKSTIENLINLAKQSMLVPVEEVVLDLWNKEGVLTGKTTYASEGSGVILLGAAQKSAVDFCKELIATSGLKVQSLELRCLAAINGLLFNWHDAPEENIAVVYLGEKQAEVAFLDNEGLFSLQTLNITDSGKQGRSQNKLLEELPRIFNTLKLSEPDCVPQRVILGAGSKAGASLNITAEQLQEKIGIKVSVCSPKAGLTLMGVPGGETDIADYQPAIGAALDGLAASPTWFDFLHPRGRITEKKKTVSWKPFVVAAAAAILLGCAYWASLVQHKITERDNLRFRITQLQPQMKAMARAKSNWTLFRSYLPAKQEGYRLSYLRILNEISRLMPDTKEAYLTSLTINGKKSTTLSAGSDITINGLVSKGDVITGKVGASEDTTETKGQEPAQTSGEGKSTDKSNTGNASTGFIARLNSSKMFYKAEQAGDLAPGGDPSDPYPFSFSVTCYLRRPEGGISEP